MSITMQTVVNPDLTALNPHSKLILFISLRYGQDDSHQDFSALLRVLLEHNWQVFQSPTKLREAGSCCSG